MKKKIALLLSVLLLLIMSGCGQAGADKHHVDHAPNGDIWETTKDLNTLPAFLDDKDERIKKVYQIAASNYEVMKWIPCYCGCGESAGHKSNMNCFFKEVENGKVVWDDHGTRCNVCMDIAVETAMLTQEGKTPLEIRHYIDEKYSKIGVEPTPTPMPQA